MSLRCALTMTDCNSATLSNSASTKVQTDSLAFLDSEEISISASAVTLRGASVKNLLRCCKGIPTPGERLGEIPRQATNCKAFLTVLMCVTLSAHLGNGGASCGRLGFSAPAGATALVVNSIEFGDTAFGNKEDSKCSSWRMALTNRHSTAVLVALQNSCLGVSFRAAAKQWNWSPESFALKLSRLCWRRCRKGSLTGSAANKNMHTDANVVLSQGQFSQWGLQVIITSVLLPQRFTQQNVTMYQAVLRNRIPLPTPTPHWFNRWWNWLKTVSV